MTRDIILPAIRKHGIYAHEDMVAHFIKRPDALLINMQALKVEQDKRRELEPQLEAAKPKPPYLSSLVATGGEVMRVAVLFAISASLLAAQNPKRGTI